MSDASDIREWWTAAELADLGLPDVPETDRGVQLMIEAAGPVSPHAAGFIAACAEYLVFSEDCGLPDVDVWVPDATLTDAEIQQRRDDLWFPPTVPNNVISLRRAGPPRP